MLKRFKQILDDAFRLPDYFHIERISSDAGYSSNESCFVSEAAQEKWEKRMLNCKYEGAYCESCAGIKDCLDKGMACRGEGDA